MNLSTELAMSFYEEVTALDQEKNIYLVKHVESGEIFVRKVLTIYDSRVYEVLSRHNLAGIPRIIEMIEDDGKLYLVEEYIHGRTLQQIFDEKGCFSPQEVQGLLRQLCGILMGLHDLTPAVVHRDIKPSNLILTPDGMLKLIDFNSAKCAGGKGPALAGAAEDPKGRDTRLLGTFHFAAPEQYGFGVSDERTDQYGLAATMNYLLTGKYPGEGAYPGRLGQVLGKCLNMEPARRYDNIEQLLSAIEGADQGWKRFLPVGFRTGKPWKMVTAAAGNLLLLYFVWIPDEESGIDLGFSIPVTLGTLATIALLFDYFGFRQYFREVFRSKVLSWVATLILVFLVLVFTILFMGVFDV